MVHHVIFVTRECFTRDDFLHHVILFVFLYFLRV